MSTSLSLFGDTFTPADPPAADACPACAGPSPRGRVCARCRRAGIEAPRLDLAATPAPEPMTPAQAHRARCDGPLMAPVFGIGRTSCAVCDWSPSDPEAPEPAPLKVPDTPADSLF